MINKKNIGFIGLGNVGSKLANNILLGNYNLFIYDLKKNVAKKLLKKGAVWSNSIKDLCEKTSIIITCLPSPKEVSNVIEGKNGVINYINKKHLWIEMSTTDENEMKRLSSLISKKGAKSLEAPITGGVHKATTGNISMLVGGHKNIYKKTLPLLSEMAYEILYCGKLGNASTLKIVTNYLASVNLLSLGEALMFCKKYGLDLKTAYYGIKISSGNSFVHETESKVILSGSYDVGFTMDLACKDLGLFDKLTDKFNIPADISKLMNKIFLKGLEKYGAKSFSTSIVKLLEEKCNENLRAPNFPKILIDKKSRKKGIEVKI